MLIKLEITAAEPADLDLLSRMFTALAPNGRMTPVPTTAMSPVSIPASALQPPTPPRAAPVPLTPAAQQGLERLEKVQAVAIPPAAEPEKRKGGRPKAGSEVPVPKPEGGYGTQEPPAEMNEENKALWHEVKAKTKRVLQAVFRCMETWKMDMKKFQDYLFNKYGDGKFSTVPQGNYEAMCAEALKGPKSSPITKDHDLEKFFGEIDQLVAERKAEAAAAGAAQ